MIQKTLKRFLAMSMFYILFGCMTLPEQYIQPSGPNIAILTFQNDSDNEIVASGFKVARDCSGGRVRFNEKKAGLAPAETFQIQVVANQEFSFVFQYSKSQKYFREFCLMPVTLYPREGDHYIAYFWASESDKQCHVKVVTVAGSREAVYRLRKWRTPLKENESFCE